MNKTRIIFFILLLTVRFSWSAAQKAPVKVACIGNSITAGSGLEYPAQDSYPAVLGRLMGRGCQVVNFGVSGCTLLSKGDRPYIKEEKYRSALEFCPDIVTIKLGTNDSKAHNWQYRDDFKQDLQQLVRSFQNLPSHPAIYLCLPIPCGREKGANINDSTIVHGVIPMIRETACEMQLPVIDLYTVLDPYRFMLPDRVHPGIDASFVIAYEIAKAIKK